ncbi:uncharacterized protein [Watersipora subatra]
MLFDDETNRRQAGAGEEFKTHNGTSVSNRIFVQKSLGYGGFGIVYKADLMHRGDERICIKMGLHKTKYQNDEQRLQGQLKVNKRLLVEAQHYRKLSHGQHPNIISMQFSCISQDFQEAFLILSQCKGTDLLRLLKHYHGRKLPSRMLRKVMTESTQAVEYCWQHKIVHCDIKPSNILFSSMNEPLKLIDFGCAVDLAKGFDGDNSLAGTFEYMAPEMLIHGRPGIKEQSDIYSLGTVFYEALIQQRPWQHDDRIHKAKRHEKKTLIKEEHLEYSKYLEKIMCSDDDDDDEMSANDVCYDKDQLNPTALQANLLERTAAMGLSSQAEHILIKDMLSFQPSQRPSCTDIIQRVSPEYAQKQTVLYEGSSESGSVFVMPGSSDGPSQIRQETTISTAGNKFMELCKISTSGDEFDPHYYGEVSAESLMDEEMRSVYASALADETAFKKELLQRMWEDLQQREADLQQREADLNQKESEIKQQVSIMQPSRNTDEIALDTCETIFEGSYLSVCITSSGKLLLGSVENFHICEQSSDISNFVQVENKDVVGIQCYNDYVYTLCADPDPFETGPRWVIKFAPEGKTYREVLRWPVPDYEHLSNLAICNDKVYVADALKSQLCVYSLTGEEILPIKHASFNRPIYLAVSPPNSIIISDCFANEVHKLNCNEDTITWSCDEIMGPRGVCCDSTDDIVWAWSGCTSSFFLLHSQTGELLRELKHSQLKTMGEGNIIGMCMGRKKVMWAAAESRLLRCDLK